MVFSQLFKSPKKTVKLTVSEGEMRFDLEGDEEFVQRALDRILRTKEQSELRRIEEARAQRANAEPQRQQSQAVPSRREVSQNRRAPTPKRLSFHRSTKGDTPHRAPRPVGLMDEDTVPDAAPNRPAFPGVSGQRTWRKQRQSFIRLHAIDRGLTRVYPLSPGQMHRSSLSKAIDFDQIHNVYVEDKRIYNRLRAKHDTVYHMMLKSSGTNS